MRFQPCPSADSLPFVRSCSYFAFNRLRGGGYSSDIAEETPSPCEVDENNTDDDSDPRSFVPEEWIGIGLQWTLSMPSHVKRARAHARRVPPDIVSLIIAPRSTSVYELLNRPDPNLGRSTGSKGPVYSSLSPTFTLSDVQDKGEMEIFQQTLFSWVPHHGILRDSFNNAWLSGAHSLSHPDAPSYRLPLWSERLVGDLQSYVKSFNLWKRSSRWLKTLESRSPLVEECETIMECIPYTGMVPGFSKAISLSISDLSLFLSDEWLNDEMINAGAEYILRQLGPRNRQRIANCFLVPLLQEARRRSSVYNPRKSSILDSLLGMEALDKLYIPLHISNNHWTLLEVDVRLRTFAYADSLNTNPTPPTATTSILEWWIDQVLPPSSSRRPFRIVHANFSMPYQRDSFSCGVVVLSTMAAILLNYAPWTPLTYASERMEWFLRMSEYLADIGDIAQVGVVLAVSVKIN